MSNFIINPFGSFAGTPYTPTLRSSATSTGTTITLPSDIEVGDIIVIADYVKGLGSAGAMPNVSGTDDGYTDISSVDSVNSYNFSFKVAVSGDASKVLSGCSGNNAADVCKVALVFEGPVTSGTRHQFSAEDTNGDPSSQTMNSSGDTVPLLVLCMLGGTSSVTLTTGSSDGSVANTAGNNEVIVYYSLYGTLDTPSDHTYDTGDNGTFNAIVSTVILLTE